MNLAYKMFWNKDYRHAKYLFKEIIIEIEELYGSHENAKKYRKRFFQEANKAKSPFYRECIKYFKGEPFERMMAYYYLGLIYLIENDFENAHASFVNGQLQDAITEEHQYQSDFLALDILCYWSASLMGSQALVEKYAPIILDSNINQVKQLMSGNVFIIVESGKGPEKRQKGKNKEILSFLCNKSVIKNINIKKKTENIHLIETGDLCWQAITRGGREIDGILAQKAIWKKDWKERKNKMWDGINVSENDNSIKQKNVSDLQKTIDNKQSNQSLYLTSMMQNQNKWKRDMLVLSKVLNESIHPEADTRAWDDLPKRIWMQRIKTNDRFIKLEFISNEKKYCKTINIYRIDKEKNLGLIIISLSNEEAGKI